MEKNNLISDYRETLEWLIYTSQPLINKIDNSRYSLKDEAEFIDFKDIIIRAKLLLCIMKKKNQGTGMSFFAMLTDKEKRQLYEKIENNEYPFYGKIKDENEAQKLKDMFENE